MLLCCVALFFLLFYVQYSLQLPLFCMLAPSVMLSPYCIAGYLFVVFVLVFTSTLHCVIVNKELYVNCTFHTTTILNVFGIVCLFVCWVNSFQNHLDCLMYYCVFDYTTTNSFLGRTLTELKQLGFVDNTSYCFVTKL